MAYLVSENTAAWLKEQMGAQTAGRRRQFLPRFQTRGGGGTADGAKLIQITGGDPLTGFTGRAFSSWGEYASGTNWKTCLYFPADIGRGGDLPNGTLVIGHPVNVHFTGGSETPQTQGEGV